MKRQVILFIAMSVDGYIAKEDGNIDFLSKVEMPGEDYGYAAFLHEIDTVIWGRKTYDKVLTLSSDFHHKNKRCIVLSKTREGSDEHVTYSNGNVKDLITELQQQPGKNIYCDGGAEAVFALLKNNLIDKMIISVIPHLLGQGIRLFKEGFTEQNIELTRSLTFPSGLVQLWYEKQLS